MIKTVAPGSLKFVKVQSLADIDFGKADSLGVMFLAGGSCPDGLNRYAYCHNNPVRYTDPTGESYEGEDYDDYYAKAMAALSDDDKKADDKEADDTSKGGGGGGTNDNNNNNDSGGTPPVVKVSVNETPTEPAKKDPKVTYEVVQQWNDDVAKAKLAKADAATKEWVAANELLNSPWILVESVGQLGLDLAALGWALIELPSTGDVRPVSEGLPDVMLDAYLLSQIYDYLGSKAGALANAKQQQQALQEIIHMREAQLAGQSGNCDP